MVPELFPQPLAGTVENRENGIPVANQKIPVYKAYPAQGHEGTKEFRLVNANGFKAIAVWKAPCDTGRRFRGDSQ